MSAELLWGQSLGRKGEVGRIETGLPAELSSLEMGISVGQGAVKGLECKHGGKFPQLGPCSQNARQRWKESSGKFWKLPSSSGMKQGCGIRVVMCESA